MATLPSMNLNSPTIRISNQMQPRIQRRTNRSTLNNKPQPQSISPPINSSRVELEDRAISQSRGVVLGPQSMLLDDEHQTKARIEVTAGFQLRRIDHQQVHVDRARTGHGRGLVSLGNGSLSLARHMPKPRPPLLLQSYTATTMATPSATAADTTRATRATRPPGARVLPSEVRCPPPKQSAHADQSQRPKQAHPYPVRRHAKAAAARVGAALPSSDPTRPNSAAPRT